MSEAKTVAAVVRGPKPYFSPEGVIYAPGQIVPNAPADEVSDEPYIEKEAMVTLPQPVVDGKGNVVRQAKETIKVRTVFKPLDGASTVAGPVTTADVATGNLDRLNVTDFLKQGPDQIVAAIASGSVDEHLGVIEQAELSRKGPARGAVKEAIAARLAATTR